MLELPSALELEALSDDELNDRITAALKNTKEMKTEHGDNSYQQKLYRALETELSRRKVTAKTKAKKIDSGLFDEDFPSD